MRRIALVFASLVMVPVGLYACGDDDNTVTPGPKDGGASETSTPDANDGSTPVDSGRDTGTDSGGKIAVRCSQAEFDQDAATPIGGDFTSFPGVDVSFPMGAGPAPYTNRCAKVKVGSQVTFAGSFSQHPLEPLGGDTPNPIPYTNKDQDGGALTITVNAPGTFGYQCEFHPIQMYGAIQVVP